MHPTSCLAHGAVRTIIPISVSCGSNCGGDMGAVQRHEEAEHGTDHGFRAQHLHTLRPAAIRRSLYMSVLPVSPSHTSARQLHTAGGARQHAASNCTAPQDPVALSQPLRKFIAVTSRKTIQLAAKFQNTSSLFVRAAFAQRRCRPRLFWGGTHQASAAPMAACEKTSSRLFTQLACIRRRGSVCRGPIRPSHPASALGPWPLLNASGLPCFTSLLDAVA